MLRVGWPSRVHVDNKGTTDGLWRGEMKCSGPKAKDAEHDASRRNTSRARTCQKRTAQCSMEVFQFPRSLCRITFFFLQAQASDAVVSLSDQEGKIEHRRTTSQS